MTTQISCLECDHHGTPKPDASGIWFCRECGFGIACAECGLPLSARHDCAEAIARWS